MYCKQFDTEGGLGMRPGIQIMYHIFSNKMHDPILGIYGVPTQFLMQ